MRKLSTGWEWLARFLATLVFVVCIVLLVVYRLDLADKLANVICALAVLIQLFAWFLPEPILPPEVVDFFARAWVEVVAALLFSLAGLVLLVLQTTFAPQTRWWWLSYGAVLLSFGAVVAVVLLTYRPPSPRRAQRFIVTGLVVLMLIAGLTTASRWPTHELKNCGAAQLAVDTPLRAPVAAALAAYQAGLASSDCADSLTVVDAADDVHDRLLMPDTPIAAVVTADPAVFKGLGGSWTNLAVLPDASTRWHTIGLDVASVFLADAERRKPRAVELSELTRLRVGRFATLDPVTSAVMTRAAGRWTPSFERDAQYVDGRPCPGHVILPTRWTGSCTAVKALTPVAVLDSDENRVGAPVLGIYLQVIDADQARPTGSARAAANDFLVWLDRHPGKIQLQTLRQPIKDVLAAVSAQNEVIQQQTRPRPVHVTVVVDASLSMGRITDRRKYGAPAPWRPTIDGLRLWALAGRRATTDRVTIVTAHTGSGPITGRTLDPAPARLERDWPRTSPHGETGLDEALAQAQRNQLRNAMPGRPHLIVLLTDGVNLFREKPVRPGLLSPTQVVVVQDGNGCAAVRRWTGNRCRGADLNAQDVAAQLTALVAKTRDP